MVYTSVNLAMFEGKIDISWVQGAELLTIEEGSVRVTFSGGRGEARRVLQRLTDAVEHYERLQALEDYEHAMAGPAHDPQFGDRKAEVAAQRHLERGLKAENTWRDATGRP